MNSLLTWFLTSSFWQRKISAVVAIFVVKFFGASDDTVAKTTAIVYLIDTVISHFIGAKLKSYAESPSPAPWVPIKQATIASDSDITRPPTGLGPIKH